MSKRLTGDAVREEYREVHDMDQDAEEIKVLSTDAISF